MDLLLPTFWMLMVAWLWMVGFYLWGRRLGDMGTVDVAWSLGLAPAVAGWFLWVQDGTLRSLVVLVLAGAWSLRLGSYILVHRVLRGPEDGRYQDLRAHWGARADRNFFLLFQFEAVLIVLFSWPALAAMTAPDSGWRWLDTLGVVIWIVAVGGESLADRQLATFLKDSARRGTTCQTGLWRYSRHPNYFFEWLHWWAYVAFAIGSPWFWLALPAPLLMYFFLVHVTGIPHVERRALSHRADFAAYQQTTSKFFPWPPKKHP